MIGMSGSDPLRARGVDLAGRLTPPPTPPRQDSTKTPGMNQEANPSILTYASVNPQQQNVDPYVSLDDRPLPSFTSTSTRATGNSQNTVPASGAQGMGGT